VPPSDVERAVAVVGELCGQDKVTTSTDEPDWISIRASSDRMGEINQTLASAGIWATGLESGSGLETLFLELTGGAGAAGAGEHAGGQGTFGVAGHTPTDA
jgi:hypothetical protein